MIFTVNSFMACGAALTLSGAMENLDYMMDYSGGANKHEASYAIGWQDGIYSFDAAHAETIQSQEIDQ